MIDRDVFLAAAKAIRTHNFDAIDEDTGRIDVIVDGAHRSVDVAEMLVWLVAEADAVRAEREVLKDAVEDEKKPWGVEMRSGGWLSTEVMEAGSGTSVAIDKPSSRALIKCPSNAQVPVVSRDSASSCALGDIFVKWTTSMPTRV